jgi:protein required for attachment to host cells
MTVRVVVADERAASVFDIDNFTAPLRPAGKIENPEAALPPRELESDRPGRAFGTMGHRHAMDGERSSRRWHPQIDLARRIAEEIDHARNQREFDRLVIMAGPRMLGLIREALPAPVRSLVAAEIPKDLAQIDEQIIRQYVPREVFWNG